MKRTILAALFSCCAFAQLFAEPYMAVREGLKCSACHVNITGGGKRTQMGSGYGAVDLPWKPADLQGMKIPHYVSLLNDLISVGADFRVFHRSTFAEDDADANTFQTDKSNLYLQANLIPDRLTLYVDESVAPGGAQTREIFGMVQNLKGRGWIKAGKFLHPYGLRLEDDRAFIREITGFNFNNPDTGVELGFQPGNFTIIAAVTNGTSTIADNDRSKQFVGTIGYIGDAFRIGTSASYNDSAGASRKMHGGWAGLRMKGIVLLAEADWIRDEDGNFEREQIVTYTELDYEIVNGWNLKLAYEYYDPNRDIEENERDRVIAGIELFPTSFVHLQLFYRFNQSIPQNILQNADELLLRLHLYF